MPTGGEANNITDETKEEKVMALQADLETDLTILGILHAKS